MSEVDGRIGSTIGGKYRIAKFLAEGGMGTVYEAQHLGVKRRFALKFLRPELVRRRDVLARFKFEAEAAGSLESENIAAALDFGVAPDGAPYIVMEYLEGIDLGRLLSFHGTLDLGRTADLVAQACAGMQQAHEAGVIHRDLKPQNMFVCRRSDGTDLLKIVDFGVAKLQDGEAASAVTCTGGMVGTPAYMSPEQARGEASLDARTDIHALGVILYELLSGHTPHPGESYNAVIYHIATQPPLPLASDERALDRALVEVVERALSPEPERRQASAAELARELAPFARRQVWPVVTRMPAAVNPDSTTQASSDVEGVVSDASNAPVAAVDGSGRWTAERPRPARRWLGFGVLLSMALGATWWSSRRAAHSGSADRITPSGTTATPAPPPALEPPERAVDELIHGASPETLHRASVSANPSEVAASTSSDPLRTRPPDAVRAAVTRRTGAKATAAVKASRTDGLAPAPFAPGTLPPSTSAKGRSVTNPSASADFDDQNPY